MPWGRKFKSLDKIGMIWRAFYELYMGQQTILEHLKLGYEGPRAKSNQQ